MNQIVPGSSESSAPHARSSRSAVSEVFRATVSSYDPSRLGRAMAAAFFDDSGATYLWPDPDERKAGLAWYYGVLVPRLGFGGGRVYTSASGGGQSVWLAPGSGLGIIPSVRAGALGFPQRYGLAATLRLKKLADTIEALRADAAPADHWYLLLLGVEPDRQGQGLGSKLMAPMFDQAAAEGRSIYLETSTPSNVPYYQARGFEIVGERRIPGAYRYWGMARRPA